MELLRGKFVFRGMPYRIGRVFVLADEKGHFTMNMLFGDGRCSECNGRAGQWGDNFYIYHHQSYLSVGDPNLFFISYFFFLINSSASEPSSFTRLFESRLGCGSR